MNREKRIIDIKTPIGYSLLNDMIQLFYEKYPFLSIGSLGKSILDRKLYYIKLGEGKKRVIYVAGHHGSEWITCGVLLRFINEYCELYKSGGRIEGIPLAEMFGSVEITVVPMLNPDGIELAVNGLDKENVMYDRLLFMNDGSVDFTHWNSNARGVDLNHNYNFGFEEYKKIESEQGIFSGAPTRYSGEYPESEPETGFLCNYLRFMGDYCGALTLHSQGEEIYYKSNRYFPKGADRIASYMSAISTYSLGEPSGGAAYGGFTDWFIREFDRPSYTIECGKGSNPLPISDLPLIYLKLRRLLFEVPLIFGRCRY